MLTVLPNCAVAVKAPAEAGVLGTAGTAAAAAAVGQGAPKTRTTAEPSTTRTAWHRRRPKTGCLRPKNSTKADPAVAAAVAARRAGVGSCCSCQSSGVPPRACPRQRRQRATRLRTTRQTLHTTMPPRGIHGGPRAPQARGRRPRGAWGSGGAAGLPSPSACRPS